MINNHFLKKLLEKERSVSIHDRKFQYLSTEMYKVSNEQSPPVFRNNFTQKNSHRYSLRLNSQFSRPLFGLYFTGPKVSWSSYLGHSSR